MEGRGSTIKDFLERLKGASRKNWLYKWMRILRELTPPNVPSEDVWGTPLLDIEDVEDVLRAFCYDLSQSECYEELKKRSGHTPEEERFYYDPLLEQKLEEEAQIAHEAQTLLDTNYPIDPARGEEILRLWREGKVKDILDIMEWMLREEYGLGDEEVREELKRIEENLKRKLEAVKPPAPAVKPPVLREETVGRILGRLSPNVKEGYLVRWRTWLKKLTPAFIPAERLWGFSIEAMGGVEMVLRTYCRDLTERECEKKLADVASNRIARMRETGSLDVYARTARQLPPPVTAEPVMKVMEMFEIDYPISVYRAKQILAAYELGDRETVLQILKYALLEAHVPPEEIYRILRITDMKLRMIGL